MRKQIWFRLNSILYGALPFFPSAGDFLIRIEFDFANVLCQQIKYLLWIVRKKNRIKFDPKKIENVCIMHDLCAYGCIVYNKIHGILHLLQCVCCCCFLPSLLLFWFFFTLCSYNFLPIAYKKYDMHTNISVFNSVDFFSHGFCKYGSFDVCNGKTRAEQQWLFVICRRVVHKEWSFSVWNFCSHLFYWISSSSPDSFFFYLSVFAQFVQLILILNSVWNWTWNIRHDVRCTKRNDLRANVIDIYDWIKR